MMTKISHGHNASSRVNSCIVLDVLEVGQRSLGPGAVGGVIETRISNIFGSSLIQRKKLLDSSREQYIKLRNPGGSGLPYSAKFRYGESFWKLHGEGCLVTIGDSYVAQVTIQLNAELNDASDFETAKTILMNNLIVKNVLLDQLLQETEDVVNLIKNRLQEIGTDCATHSDSARCILELRRIAEKHKYAVNLEFAREILSSQYVQCEHLKSAIDKYAAKENKLKERNLFQRMKNYFKKKDFLKESLKEILEQHKQQLLQDCPAVIKENVRTLDPNRCLLLKQADIKLFSDLDCIMNQTMLGAELTTIAIRFMKRIRAIEPEYFCQSLPMANGVYFYVCKSMLEMAERVETEIDVEKIIKFTEYGWTMATFDRQRVKSALDRCLVRQLQMLVDLVNHFEPGKLSVREKYPYEFKLFKNTDSVQSELYLWLCLVDATIESIFQGNSSRIREFPDVAEMFHKFVSSEDFRHESQESFRMITHNTLEFVAQVELAGYGRNNMDRVILQKQIRFMNQAFLGGKKAFSQYRDVTDVFMDYWKRCNDVLPELPSKLPGNYLKPLVKELQSRLLEIASQALNKKVHIDVVTNFFRAFNELFMELKNLPFKWFVRICSKETRSTLIKNNVVECVENKLKNTDNECYRVVQHDKFVENWLGEEIPKHYQLKILKTFLDEIFGLSKKKCWKVGRVLIEEDQLKVMILLIAAIKSSLLYLKEQPDYIDFEAFYQETIKPFRSVVDKSDSLENFTKRVSLIKESFWYIRNQNAISIDKALELFKPINSVYDEEILTAGFKCYNDQFEKFMSEYGTLDRDEKIRQIVQHVRSKVTVDLLSSEWTAEFKQHTVPIILAGLGTVWSIMVSEDVASSGKYLKPHSIQILSVLRLLSVDKKGKGVEKHLTEILTGQGKSVILGLVAAVLAMCNHDVVVVCYSKYLAHRDSNDFHDLFQMFSINSKISYKTFGDMVWEQIRLLTGKAKKHVSDCIGIPCTNDSPIQDKADLSKSVLLIDEVDVFFMDIFYGNTYNPAFFPVIPGLSKVQEKIWELVQNENTDIESIEHFVRNSSDPEVTNLRSLIDRQQIYTLINTHPEVTETQYTNKSLFSAQLKQMIDTAKDVAHRPIDDNLIRQFRLDSDGIITYKDDLGEFRSTYFSGYNNTFVYFKLQKNNFVQNVKGTDNYGYLNLALVCFSYAKLPENYPLILGVTGTLKGLNSYEKRAIKDHYKISYNSFMPSFFGCSNLKFNQVENFKCLPDENEWRKTIFSQINTIIGKHRSVLVFFDNEVEIGQFRKDFNSKLDRLNEITMNTDVKLRERNITDAGVERTVTLATREMGRGVDYKTSMSVEQNGGIHVIQTFFSLDDKEETQIKGRTARKDNHGSYELIVCLPQLVALALVDKDARDDSINYELLEDSRRQLIDKAGESKAKQLEKANTKHEKSIRFCENC